MSPNRFVGFDPLSADVGADLLRFYWLVALVLLLAVVATAVERRRWRRRPRGRLGERLVRPNLWSLPILVWAFLTSWATKVLLDLGQQVGVTLGFFTKLLLFHGTLALCLLVLLQVVAVALVDRERSGIGVGGHARVAVVYAAVSVILDGFVLLCFYVGNWPY